MVGLPTRLTHEPALTVVAAVPVQVPFENTETCAVQLAPCGAPHPHVEHERVSESPEYETCFAVKGPVGHARSPACMMHRPDWKGVSGFGAQTSPFAHAGNALAPPHARATSCQVGAETEPDPDEEAQAPPLTTAAGTLSDWLQGVVPAWQVPPPPGPHVLTPPGKAPFATQPEPVLSWPTQVGALVQVASLSEIAPTAHVWPEGGAH
jgi:hypothetical protein